MTNDEENIRHSSFVIQKFVTYSVSTIARPPYWPQFGQITCEGFIVPHFGQACSCLAFRPWCERRMPVREFDCLRLGTAMGIPVDQPVIYTVLKNPPAYDPKPRFVKCERLSFRLPTTICCCFWDFVIGTFRVS